MNTMMVVYIYITETFPCNIVHDNRFYDVILLLMIHANITSQDNISLKG